MQKIMKKRREKSAAATNKNSSIRRSNIDDDEVMLKNAQFFSAIGEGNLNAVKELLESGVKADINDKNNEDNSPLHYAVEEEKKEIVAELLDPKWGTNLNLKNKQGRTPLDIARLRHNKEIIELLKNHFQKTPGSAGMAGQLYEINIAILLLLIGKSNQSQFYLASNFEKGDKFDDVVFKYTDKTGKSKTIFLQSKHKTTEKPVLLKNLITTSETGDFSLSKYFASYKQIKKFFLSNENPDDPVMSGRFDECEFLLYTNSPFNYGGSSLVKQIKMDKNDLFKIKNSQGKIYQLDFNSGKEELLNLLKKCSECEKLANTLAKAFKSKDGLDIKKDIVKKYHKALKEKVIKKANGSNGKLRDDFFSNTESKFRIMFLQKAAEVFETAVGEIGEFLMEEIKLSEKFWDENASGFSELPDDSIEEHEVENFFKKFKLYADQPNVKELESVIKNNAMKLYNIGTQDIDPVFAEILVKAENWWQYNSNYLMRDNKFFEEALRVSVQFDVERPVPSFIGREKLLKDLHEILQKGETRSPSQIALITGLGGTGKSELARRYLSDYKEHYNENLIWINAENNLTITRSFQKLAHDKLGIKTTGEDYKEKDTNLLAEEVYNFFAKVNRKGIFVFDNAEKPDGHGEWDVVKLLPKVLNEIYVIITTRDQHWDGIMNLNLGLFSQEEAEMFVRNELKGSIDIQVTEVQLLIKELDYLPLALKQAVAYISMENDESKKWKNEEFNITCYLDLFQAKAKKILNAGKLKNQTQTVLKTWEKSIEKIKQKSLEALEIFQVMAYLAPDQIPAKDIFWTEAGGENKILDDAKLLEKYSMIHLEGGMVKIHRLVQKVTRIAMEESMKNEETLSRTFTVLTTTFPYGKDEMDNCYKKRRMLPHFEVLVSHIEEFMEKRPEERARIEKEYLSDLFEMMADGYDLQPGRRKELLERALKIKENVHGTNHFEVAITLVNLGNAFGDLGDTKKQKRLLERALTIFETNNLDNDPIYVPTTLKNLGIAYGVLGDAQKKIELLERAKEIEEKHFGTDHFTVAVTLENLAITYGDLSNLKKQKEELEKVLKIKENHHGPSHFEVAKTLAHLGNANGALGDTLKKKKQLQRALKIEEKYYGPDHFKVAATLVSLSNAFGALGSAKKQRELAKRALIMKENHYGPDHNNVTSALANLGYAYGTLGDVEKQKQLAERALKIQKNQYGSEHINVAIPERNLGNAWGALGNTEEQIKLLEHALKIQEHHLGTENINVALTLIDLGNAYGALGDIRKQKKLLDQALAIQIRQFGPGHINLAKTLIHLGIANGNLGNPLKKKQLHERARTITKTFYGPSDFGLEQERALWLEARGQRQEKMVCSSYVYYCRS